MQEFVTNLLKDGLNEGEIIILTWSKFSAGYSLSAIVKAINLAKSGQTVNAN